MSDYLGPNQTRVLDSTNRNFESITYQLQKPPLSNEVNLTGKIDAERSQKVVQAVMPSGWAGTGQFRNDVAVSACQVGDVLCSPDCSSNSFWFVAQDFGVNSEKNVAFVNGWRVVVQGSSSPQGNKNDNGSVYLPYTNTTEDNLIRLPEPPESRSRIDFVFLEVWRKLLTPDDNIYQYGNVDHANPFANDLIDPARGFETSLRVQVQYRIRVATIDDIDLHPEGMNSPSVHVQGPNPLPITDCDHSFFSPVPGDPGLWIAGAGDAAAQEALGTVDGHTYAIPMFAIRRRNTQPFDPRISQINGTDRSLADYKNGQASDRPDNRYNDWVTAEDFVDLRHRVGLGGDLKNVCSQAFRALQNNTLKTYMNNSTVGGEQDGAVLVRADAIQNGTHPDYDWAKFLGFPDGVRRWFANAVSPDSSIPASDEGLSEVPTKFLEARQITGYPDTMYPIAMQDQDIRVRYGIDSSAVDTSNYGRQYNMLRIRGGIYKDVYNFGHQMIYHKVGQGTTAITVPKNISGYNIVGIADISLDNGVTSEYYSTIVNNPSETDYTVNMGLVPSGNDIRFTLYTDSKFFYANKQGRGITDCYQTTTVLTNETPDGVNTFFTLSPPTANDEILALGSYSRYDGTGVAYVNNSIEPLITTNLSFDGTNIVFLSPPPASLSNISVPVLLHTAALYPEEYAFFYEYIPYQGLLDTTNYPYVTGAIEAQGPSIATSSGSGAVLNFSSNTSGYTASAVYTGTKTIIGNGTDWSSSGNIRPGYLISSSLDTTTQYRVEEVVTDSILYVNSLTDRISMGYETFSVVAMDTPAFNYPNIIDRLPTLNTYNDHSGISDGLVTVGNSYSASIDVAVSTRIQDITDVPVNAVKIGLNPADRGRSTVNIPGAPYGRGNLGIEYDGLWLLGSNGYKKTYQAYLLNKDNSGRLYLMVVGSETGNNSTVCKFNAFSDSDTVDIFEIPGRPLLTNRVQ